MKKYLCIILTLLPVCGVLQAQETLSAATATATTAAVLEPVRLSPDEAVDRAVRNNLSLESARVSTATKKRASDLWWNQFIPSVTVAGSLIMDNEQGTVSGMAPLEQVPLNPLFGPNLPADVPNIYGVVPYSVEAPRWHVAGTIQASLTLSVAVFGYVKQLRLDYQGGLISYDKAKLQLERDIRKEYNNMLLLQENINLFRDSYEAAGRRVEMARANYRAGLVPELVFLQAQVAVENMKPTMDQLENGSRLSMARFAMLLGMDYDTPFELIPLESTTAEGASAPSGAASPSGDGFISLDLREMISRAAAGKPDIQELRHNILQLQSARKLQIQSLTPALTFSWNTMSAFTRDPWKDDWGDSDFWNKSGSFTISLGLRLHSLIPWSPDFQGIRKLDDQIRTVNIGLGQLIQGTEIEIYNIILSLERIRIASEAQAQTVSLAERSHRLTEQAYRAGLQDLLQVQNAELELRQARVAALEQRFNYLNSLIDLEYAIGVPFGTLTSKENE